MKSLACLYYIPTFFVLLVGCNNSSDPVRDVKKENKEKIDSQLSVKGNIDSVTAAVLPSKEDADFLVNAASGGMLEVQLGQLAQVNSGNQRVKNYGSMMVKDHGEEAEKLKALAASKNITLPDTISNRQLKEKTKLQKLKGNAFDVAYLNMMVVDHKKDINEFEKETSRGTDPDIKSFALDNLRILHKHLDSATTIQKLVTPKKIVIEEPIYP